MALSGTENDSFLIGIHLPNKFLHSVLVTFTHFDVSGIEVLLRIYLVLVYLALYIVFGV